MHHNLLEEGQSTGRALVVIEEEEEKGGDCSGGDNDT